METLIERIEHLTGFREALKEWVQAKGEANRLDIDLKVARARAYLDGALDDDGKKRTSDERRATVAVATEELTREAESAKVKATALYFLVLHLKDSEAAPGSGNDVVGLIRPQEVRGRRRGQGGVAPASGLPGAVSGPE